MLIEDLIGSSIQLERSALRKLQEQCSQYLEESRGLPLFKALPSTYSDIHRVKARLQKRIGSVDDAFNNAFGQAFPNLHQRAIFASAAIPILSESTESFYILPVNGYRFMYSCDVANSAVQIEEMMQSISNQFRCPTSAGEVVADILKHKYISTDLHEGIISESEIIFYGIPCYYAVRVNSCDAYATLMPSLHI